jgi:putative transcription factor
MICDMCGSEGKLFKAVIEDAELKVCDNCSKFGKVISVIQQNKAKIPPTININPQPEASEILIENYAKKIREKRESLSLKQEEFAKKINEKESLMQKIESGNFEPSIELAKRIGKFLRINLVEEYKEEHENQTKAKADSFTIADFIKVKQK